MRKREGDGADFTTADEYRPIQWCRMILYTSVTL